MRRLLTSTPLPAVLGLAVALQCLFAQTCSAEHLLVLEHGLGLRPLSPVHSDGLDASVQPFAMVSHGSRCSSGRRYSRTQMPPARRCSTPIAPVAPTAAAGYTPYTYGYYTYGSTSSVAPIAPVVPTALGAGSLPSPRRRRSLPVSPYQHLAGYDPDAPISPRDAGHRCCSFKRLVARGQDPQSPHQHGLLQPRHRQRQGQPSSDGHQHLRRPDRLFAGDPGRHGPGEDRGQGFQAAPGGLGT